MTPHAERARQWVHVGSGVFALLLRVLTWWQAAAVAAFALLFNLLVLPRIGGRRLYRPIDEARGFPLGILLYPLSVLLLIIVFPSRPDIAAAGWGILALGDGAATLVGQAIMLNAKRARTAKKSGSAALAAFAFFRVAGAYSRTGRVSPGSSNCRCAHHGAMPLVITRSWNSRRSKALPRAVA